jgi:hypothetical protein
MCLRLTLGEAQWTHRLRAPRARQATDGHGALTVDARGSARRVCAAVGLPGCLEHREPGTC